MKQFSTGLSKKFLLLLVGMLCASLGAYAQQIAVTGTVVDSYGDPLIGATVLAQGSSHGVATDIDGNYKIEVSPNATLVFSYVGFDTQSIPVNGRTVINVELKENSVVLNEVVAIGYGTVKKSDATGSVAVIKPDEIEAGLATSVQDMLVGATPGVVVTQTGDPSSGGNIIIRGGSSLSASNDPLIVIDGVPINGGSVKGSSNPMALVSPDNIESMTVLKDASATAIYGSRASNGVIIITTKKGQSGKPQVNFAANMYINTPRKYMNMMSASEFTRFITDTYGAESAQAQDGLFGADTDWQKEILRTSISSDYSLSVGGTVGALPYRVAVNYTNNNGIINNSAMDRVGASINLSPKFFGDLLAVNANVKGAYVRNNYGGRGLGGAVSFNPTVPVHSNNVFNNWSTYISGGALANAETIGAGINTLASINPVSENQDYYNIGKVWQSVGNIQFDLKMPFLRELRANLNLGYDYSKGDDTNYDHPFSPNAWKGGGYVPDLDADYKPIPGKEHIDKYGLAGIGYESQKRLSLLLEYYMNYNKDFKAINSNLDVTAGYSWQKFSNKGHNWGTFYAPYNDASVVTKFMNSYNAVNDDQLTFEQAKRYMQGIDGYQRTATYYYSSPYQLVSFFGRLQYGYADRYLLTATVRRDGSSRFADNNRWGTFPSVALAWRAIGEEWMEGARGWLSDLKLRLTWGVTGQQNLGDTFDMLFPYLPVYDVSTSLNQMAPFATPGSANGYFLVTPQKYNASLKWEETTTWNIGLDFGFINNRIMGSVDLYKRITKDMLTTTTYAAGSNFAPDGPLNLGDMENTGVEVNLLTKPVVTRDFTWSSNLNVAYNQNKITHLAYGKDIPLCDVGNNVNVQLQREGEPAYSFYVFEQVYLPNGEPAEGVYVDRDGDGDITDADKYIFHSANPDLTLNWQNTFNYKNWDLGFAFRGSFNNWVYNQNEKNNAFASSTSTVPLSNIMADTYIWKEKRSTLLVASDYWVQNASFVRCENITLGYTWAQLLNNKLRLRLYGAVQNPFVITKYRGMDPEVFRGNDNSVYPKPTTYTVGLVATF